MQIRIFSLILLLGCSAGCVAQTRPAPNPADSSSNRFVGPSQDFRSPDEIAIPIPCESVGFPVHSISKSQAKHSCALALLARAGVAQGKARQVGVPPKDTTNIKVALIGYFEISDDRGVVLERYMSVDLGLRNKEFGLSYKLSSVGSESFLKAEPLEVPRSGKP